jgi:hypothetical protein
MTDVAAAEGALRARGGVAITTDAGERRVLFFNLNAIAAMVERLEDEFDARPANVDRLREIRAIGEFEKRQKAFAAYDEDRRNACCEEGVMHQLALRTPGKLLRVVVWAGLLHEKREGWTLEAAGDEFDRDPTLAFAALLALQKTTVQPDELEKRDEAYRNANADIREEALAAAAAVILDPFVRAAGDGMRSGKRARASA